MTSIVEPNQQAVDEYKQLVQSLAASALRYGKAAVKPTIDTVMTLMGAGPLAPLVSSVAASCLDELLNHNTEDARVRAEAAAAVAKAEAVTRTGRKEMSPQRLKTILENSTSKALRDRMEEKLQIVVATQFSMPEDGVPSPVELMLAEWVSAQQIGHLRGLQELLEELFGEQAIPVVPYRRATKQVKFAAYPTHAYYERLKEQHSWLMDAQLIPAGGREKMTQLFVLDTFHGGANGTIFEDEMTAKKSGSVWQGYLWPRQAAFMLHNAFVIEREMMAFELKEGGYQQNPATQ